MIAKITYFVKSQLYSKCNCTDLTLNQVYMREHYSTSRKSLNKRLASGRIMKLHPPTQWMQFTLCSSCNVHVRPRASTCVHLCLCVSPCVCIRTSIVHVYVCICMRICACKRPCSSHLHKCSFRSSCVTLCKWCLFHSDVFTLPP